MISVVIPIFNEENNIEPMYKRMSAVFDKLNVPREFVYVNDGSKDNSAAIIFALAEEHSDVKYINFSRSRKTRKYHQKRIEKRKSSSKSCSFL